MSAAPDKPLTSAQQKSLLASVDDNEWNQLNRAQETLAMAGMSDGEKAEYWKKKYFDLTKRLGHWEHEHHDNSEQFVDIDAEWICQCHSSHLGERCTSFGCPCNNNDQGCKKGCRCKNSGDCANPFKKENKESRD
jgi:hypothetical protein